MPQQTPSINLILIQMLYTPTQLTKKSMSIHFPNTPTINQSTPGTFPSLAESTDFAMAEQTLSINEGTPC